MNLSISLKGGKENNNDFFSSGEWTRKSSYGKIHILYRCIEDILFVKIYWEVYTIEGYSPVTDEYWEYIRVTLFGSIEWIRVVLIIQS